MQYCKSRCHAQCRFERTRVFKAKMVNWLADCRTLRHYFAPIGSKRTWIFFIANGPVRIPHPRDTSPLGLYYERINGRDKKAVIKI